MALMNSDEMRRIFEEASDRELDEALLFNGVRPFQPKGLITLPTLEPDGRDSPLDYEHPLQANDLIEDPLDSEVVFRMKEAPEDPLDNELQMEAHIEICPSCAANNGAQICAHCLEPRICKPVVIGAERKADRYVCVNKEGVTLGGPAFIPKTIPLCRRCRTRSDNGHLGVSE